MAEGFPMSQNSPRPDTDHNAGEPSELPTHGSTASELIIKASPYQELACSGSKRKTGSVGKGKRQNAGSKAQPVKGLKIIHHRFSNGRSGNGQVETNNGVTTNDNSSRNNEPSLASPGHLMYQDTRSGTWRTTKRLPRKKDITLGDSESPKRRRTGKPQIKKSDDRSITLSPEKSDNRPATLSSESTSHDNASAPSESQDSSACHQGGVIAHLCTGEACEFPGCYPSGYDFQAIGAQFDGDSFTSQLFSPDNHINDQDFETFGSDNYINNPGLDTFGAGNHINSQGFGTFGGEVPFTHGHQPIFATVSAPPPPPVSPVARGLVWESRATRRARRQNELAQNNGN